MENGKKQVSRRRFVQAATASAALLAVAGCSQQNQVAEAGAGEGKVYRLDPELDSAVEGRWVTVACDTNCGGRCVNKAYVVDGIVVRQKTDDGSSDNGVNFQNRACPRGRALQQQTFGADRLKYPIKRKNWEPTTGGNRELRGVDEWERISWEKAISYVAAEMKRIYTEFGGKSVYVSGWGGGDIGNILNSLGGYVMTDTTESYGCWQLCHTQMGTSFVNNNPDTERANDRLDLVNAETVVMYGSNSAWASAGSPSWHFMNVRDAGAQFVYVGASRNITADALDARWIPVRVGTDTAFLLGVVYAMLEKDEAEGLIDWDFLHTYCVGFDAESMPSDAKLNENFKDYVLGAYDGTPKTPEWAHEICGTPIEDINWFATAIGKKNKVMLLHSYAAARQNGAENLPQLFMTVGAMGGHMGKSGHATGAIYHYEAANAGPRLVEMPYAGGAYVPNPVTDAIPGPQIWRAMLDGKYTYYGSLGGPENMFAPAEERPLDIRMIYSYACNFLQSKMNINDGIKAFRKAEFVVAQDWHLSLSCQYADIVLPICSQWESWEPLGSGIASWINRDTQIFPLPVLEEGLFESHADGWIAEQLATELGLDVEALFPQSLKQRYFDMFINSKVFVGGKLKATKDNWTGMPFDHTPAEGDTDSEQWKPLMTITQEDLDEFGIEGAPQEGVIPMKELLEKGVYQVERQVGDGKDWIGYADFVEDPVKNPRPLSNSGKLEIYCQKKADMINLMGSNETPMKPYPHYIVPVEGYEATFSDWENKVKGEYPFQMYSPHYIRRSHTTYDNAPWLQEAFENPVFLNESDGEALGIKTGDTVLISSKYGQVLRHASLLGTIVPGCVGLPHGVRTDIDPETGIDKGGSENTLHGPVQSNYLPQLSGYNSCLLKIEKYNGEPIPHDYEKQFIVGVE